MATALSSLPVTHHDETLREATLEDFPAVLDIGPHGKLGLDYLPSTYNALIQGSGVKGYVYEKAGKVAAFLSTERVDGGLTLVTSAGRVRKDCRGQGMYGRFTRHVFRQWVPLPQPLPRSRSGSGSRSRSRSGSGSRSGSRSHSGPRSRSGSVSGSGSGSADVMFLAFTVSTVGLEKFGNRLLSSYTIVLEKMMTCIDLDVDGVRSAIFHHTHAQTAAQPGHRKLQTLGHHDLGAMLRHAPSQLRHLFPQQRILLNWYPYRVMPANTDVIFHSHHRVFLAATEDLAAITAPPKGSDSDFPITLLSCGSGYPCERGLNYDVDIFGAGSDADLRAHLEWHVRRLVALCEEGRGEKKGVMKIFHESCLGIGGLLPGLFAGTDFPLHCQSLTLPFHNVSVLEADISAIVGIDKAGLI